jgi:hypothetical protein
LDDDGSRFGKGRSWAERTTFQRVSLILDVVVVVLLFACAGYTILAILSNPG